MEPVRRSSVGPAVAEVRATLASIGLLNNTDAGAAELFDDDTELAVRHFQQHRGLSVDGIVGPETYAALSAARWQLGDRVLHHTPAALMLGDDVRALQERLVELGYDLGRPDSVFGRKTEEALRAFQREMGLHVDGICGHDTLRALKQLGRRVIGGSPLHLRDRMAVDAAGPSLPGKRIVIDPGHGGTDTGVTHDGVTEAELVWDIASRLEGRLRALGVATVLTRGPATGSTDTERAELANVVGADLLVSLHIDAHHSPLANGVAAYYYGAGQSVSWAGERLADLMLREIVARTGMINARAHAKTWALLRMTRMTAVRVELGYLSSPVDRGRLVDAAFRDSVAEGLLIAVQRLYLPEDAGPPTGVMRLPITA